MKKLILIALTLGACVSDNLPVEEPNGTDTVTDPTNGGVVTSGTAGRPVTEATILLATEVDMAPHHGPKEVANFEISTMEATLDNGLSEICALASQLPIGNVCSQLCNPDGFIAHVVGDGTNGGRCYDYQCELPGHSSVQVGVCLP